MNYDHLTEDDWREWTGTLTPCDLPTKKTSFESDTYEGGRCFFYLEDVADAEMLPETNCLVSSAVFPERVRVYLDTGSVYILPGSEYDRLVDRLRGLKTNQQS